MIGRIYIRDNDDRLRTLLETICQRKGFQYFSEAMEYCILQEVKKKSYNIVGVKDKINQIEISRIMDGLTPKARLMYPVDNVLQRVYTMLVSPTVPITKIQSYITQHVNLLDHSKYNLHEELKILKELTPEKLQQQRLNIHHLLKTRAYERVDLKKKPLLELKTAIEVLDSNEFNPPKKSK